MLEENFPQKDQVIINSEQFVEQLRFALNHLYDLDNLKKSVLIQMLKITDRFDAPLVLQKILLESIHACQPNKSEPVCSIRYRIFQILTLRYEQQFHQKEIANQMGISERQYRRLQKIAIGELASKLAVKFSLVQKLEQNPSIDLSGYDVPNAEIPEEISWISKLPSNSSTYLQDLMPEISNLIKPLAIQHQKDLSMNVGDELIEVAIPPQVLRQVILNILNAMVLFDSGRVVSFNVSQRRWNVELCVSTSFCGPEPLPEAVFPNLKITQALINFYGGKLHFSSNQGVFSVQATLPEVNQITVMVIDDNADALNLYQHYVYGTRYRLIVSSSAIQTIELAETHMPQVILIDIMMPEIDGWEVLVRLKNHPLLSHIPVIVCTVLDQAELARALGANGFLHKPVSRQNFLRELDHQIEQLG